jgi:hypothetical protein
VCPVWLQVAGQKSTFGIRRTALAAMSDAAFVSKRYRELSGFLHRSCCNEILVLGDQQAIAYEIA